MFVFKNSGSKILLEIPIKVRKDDGTLGDYNENALVGNSYFIYG